MPVENTSEPQFELTVDQKQWKRVATLDHSGPNDPVFVLDSKTGTISFGDGARGQRPSSGSSIQASYRYGGGAEGRRDNGPTITLTWTSKSFRKNEVIGAIIKSQADGIAVRVCMEYEVPHRWQWIAIFRRSIKKWALRLTCRFI